MKSCLWCGTNCPEDSNTCSSECTHNWIVSGKDKSPVYPNPEVVPTNEKELVDSKRLSSIIGLSAQIIGQMSRYRKLPYTLNEQGERRYHIPSVRTALEKPGLKYDVAPVPNQDPAIFIPAGHLSPQFKAQALDLTAYRELGLRAAKYAFRDVILVEADQAKANGNHELRAKLLEDFIFFEEGVELIYKGREDAGLPK